MFLINVNICPICLNLSTFLISFPLWDVAVICCEGRDRFNAIFLHACVWVYIYFCSEPPGDTCIRCVFWLTGVKGHFCFNRACYWFYFDHDVMILFIGAALHKIVAYIMHHTVHILIVKVVVVPSTHSINCVKINAIFMFLE